MLGMHLSNRPGFIRTALALGLLALGAGPAAGTPPATAVPATGDAPAAVSPVPAANLLFTATTMGNASICGCRGAKAGGLARRATVLKNWDAAKDGPYAWVDGGSNLVFGSSQEVEISALILKTMEELGCAAAVVGSSDLDNRVGHFEVTIGASRMNFVSANLRYHDTGERVFAPWRIISIPRTALAGSAGPGAAAPPIRIGLIGLSSLEQQPASAGARGRTIFRTDPLKELQEVLPGIRARSDIVVVATSQDAAAPDRLLASSPDVDVLVSGLDHRSWAEPRTIGRTAVMVAGDRGREIIRVAIFPAGAGYRVELSKIQLTEEMVAEDPPVARSVGEVLDRLNEQSRAAMTAWVASNPARPIAPWAGALKCAGCHPEAGEIWSRTAHAHAIRTLRDIKRDFTKACVYCHVTGWDSPDGGGFADPATTAVLNDVQCEACHGAGAKHIEDPSAPYGAVETPATCVGCHDPANSAEFNYPTYWPRIAH